MRWKHASVEVRGEEDYDTMKGEDDENTLEQTQEVGTGFHAFMRSLGIITCNR